MNTYRVTFRKGVTITYTTQAESPTAARIAAARMAAIEIPGALLVKVERVVGVAA